jgi:phospholipase/lecithinase/hemolysin
MKIFRTSLWVLLLSMTFALPSSTAAQEPKFDSFFVFSDSLGDTGNDWILTKSFGAEPAIPPSESPHRTYFRGRFSNGPILFEHLWSQLGPEGELTPSLAVRALPKKGGISFAYGGSTSGTTCFPLAGLRCQVEQYAQLLGSNPAPQRALFAVFSGSNDILQAENPFDPAVVVGIVSNVTAAIQRLYALGARDIMVLNMPNLGLAPLVQDPAAKIALNSLAQQHNALLSAALTGLSSSLPGIRIIPIDIYSHLQSLVATSAFNFQATALPLPIALCLFDEAIPEGSNCTDVPLNADRRYFFWDVEHPTKAAHQAFGEFLYKELRAFYRQ